MTLKGYVNIVSNFITENMENLILCVIILSIITLISFIIVNLKLSKMTKYNELTKGADRKQS